MAAGGGGAWKVAYADFVTAMMAFFMVMWITAQNKQMKTAVAHYFNDPFNSLSKTKGPESAGSTTTGPLAPGRRRSCPPSSPATRPASNAPRTLPSRSAARSTKSGPKKWAGEGNKSAGVGKPTLLVLHDGKEPEMGTVLLFAEQTADLNDKAQDQLKRLLPLLVGQSPEDRDPRTRPAALRDRR